LQHLAKKENIKKNLQLLLGCGLGKLLPNFQQNNWTRWGLKDIYFKFC